MFDSKEKAILANSTVRDVLDLVQVEVSNNTAEDVIKSKVEAAKDCIECCKSAETDIR